MRVQHNIMAMNAYRNYTTNVSAMKKNLERLSSGYKINRAGDDAAGLAISEKMRAQITGLEAAQKNAKDGISLVQTAEGALTEVHDMLNRMVELATQSANGTYDNNTDRYQLQKEMDELKAEINRIADSANFNGIKLLDGSMSTASGSAIVNIESTAFQKASTADGAIDFTVDRVRPNAGNSGTKASFEVSLDELGLTKALAGTATGVSITITVNGVAITASLTLQGGASTSYTASAIVSQIMGKLRAGSIANTGSQVAGLGSITGGQGALIVIGGHVWQIAAGAGSKAGTLQFTQMDKSYMDSNDPAVVPDGWTVSVEIKQTAASGSTPTIEWKADNVNKSVQNTKYYDPSGTGLQARVDMDIDFNKLKDGDTFQIGSITYTIKLDKNSTYASTGSKPVIDLSGYDLTDETQQKEALADIVAKLNGNSKWSAGDYGMKHGVGSITLQSKSSTKNNDKQPGSATTYYDLSTETKVMNEFKYKSTAKAATVSFEVDPSKIHEGDTFIINGVTYEFTKSSKVSNSGNIAVNLGSVFDEDGGVDMTADAILQKIKTAATTADKIGSQPKYTVTVENGRITFTAKDDPNTADVDESRIDIKLTGVGGSGLMLQIGDTSDSYNQLRVNINDCHVAAIGLDKISIAEQTSAQSAISAIKDAINYISDVRGTLGATQNRLDHTINNLSVMTENIQDAESSIRDTDIAEEMMAYTKNNILIQASQAMLAQANQVPQGVLQLLQ